MKQNVKRAFSLIELLVVISIIALLIAILLPALSQARESANTTICQSNIGSIAKAQLAYAVDNDGYYTMSTEWVWSKSRYPDGSRDPGSERFDPTVLKNIEQGTIFPYHSVIEAFVCPVAVDKLPSRPDWVGNEFIRSYVQNGEAGPSASKEWSDKNWTEEEQVDTLRVPADFVLFNEENTFSIKGWNTFNNKGMNDALFRLQPFDYDVFGSFHKTGTELGTPDGSGYYSADEELCSGVSYAAMADGAVEEVNYKGRMTSPGFTRVRWSRMWSKDDIPVER